MEIPKRIRQNSNYVGYLKDDDLANVFDYFVDKNGYANYNLNQSVSFKGVKELPVNVFELYTIRSGDTLMKIANELYNNINLWWILAKLNNISNSFVKLNAGDMIRVFTSDQMDKFRMNFRTLYGS